MSKYTNYSESVSAPTTTWAPLLAYNPTRSALIIFNTGSVNVSVGISEAGAITVPAGEHLAFPADICPMNALSAKSVSGTGALVIWEG